MFGFPCAGGSGWLTLCYGGCSGRLSTRDEISISACMPLLSIPMGWTALDLTKRTPLPPFLCHKDTSLKPEFLKKNLIATGGIFPSSVLISFLVIGSSNKTAAALKDFWLEQAGLLIGTDLSQWPLEASPVRPLPAEPEEWHPKTPFWCVWRCVL